MEYASINYKSTISKCYCKISISPPKPFNDKIMKRRRRILFAAFDVFRC